MADAHFGLTKIAFLILGLWPSHLLGKRKRFLKLPYKAYSRIVQLIFALFVVSQYADACLKIDKDFQSVSDNLGVAILYTSMVLKIHVCKGETVVDLINRVIETELGILGGSDEEAKLLYLEEQHFNRNIIKFYYALGAFTIAFFFGAPMIEEQANGDVFANSNLTSSKARPLPFHSWFPFDKNEHYHLAYSLHLIAGSYGCGFVVCTALLFISMITFCTGQIKILKRRIKRCDFGGSKDGILFGCVKTHQMIIAFADDFNRSIRHVMFFDFTVLSVQIAMVIFQIMTGGLGIQQVNRLEYLLGIICYLFIFYWFCNELTVQSEDVAKAIWESDWYKCSKYHKQILQIMMRRSQKPLKVTIGPLQSITNSTALAILKASYSYATLMQQTYVKKNAQKLT